MTLYVRICFSAYIYRDQRFEVFDIKHRDPLTHHVYLRISKRLKHILWEPTREIRTLMYIDPCGCPTGMLGALARRQSVLRNHPDASLAYAETLMWGERAEIVYDDNGEIPRVIGYANNFHFVLGFPGNPRECPVHATGRPA